MTASSPLFLDRIRFHTAHKYPSKDLFRFNVFLEFVLSVHLTMRVYGVGRQWVSPVFCCYSRPPPHSVRHVNIPGVKRTVENNVNFTENYLRQIDSGSCHVYFPSSFTRFWFVRIVWTPLQNCRTFQQKVEWRSNVLALLKSNGK